MKQAWRLNTSNRGKLREFQQLFQKYGCTLSSTHVDLKEIDADPVTVVVHKASQLEEGVLVEDTSLHIEESQVGIHVKWLLKHLKDYIGRKATWEVLLAYTQGDKVYIYRGIVQGTIVPPQGTEGFGFDPVFLPDGFVETLAESKPDAANARSLAVKALMEEQPFAVRPLITTWEGRWQEDEP